MSVTAKKKLRDLVERMSEREAEALLEKAEEVDRDPMLELLDNAPLDDEPLPDEDEEAVAAAREYLDSFVEETGWQPTICASFAGAILYSHYGTFERILMRLIMRRKGHGDVKWDQEYTDWEAVAAFAKDFAAAVAGHAARRPGEGQADGVTRRRFR